MSSCALGFLPAVIAVRPYQEVPLDTSQMGRSHKETYTKTGMPCCISRIMTRRHFGQQSSIIKSIACELCGPIRVQGAWRLTGPPGAAWLVDLEARFDPLRLCILGRLALRVLRCAAAVDALLCLQP